MDNTKKIFREVNAEAMLTADEDLRRYLTGFPSSFGYVYTDTGESVFFTDPRYAEAAKQALAGTFTAVEIARSEDAVLEYVKEKGIRSLAVPFERVSLPLYEKLHKQRWKLTDSMPAFTAAMAHKDGHELACIREACRIAEEAFALLLPELKEGMTELEAAGLLEYLMLRGGAEDRSFKTIAAFGRNTSVPHHASGTAKLQNGMPVLLDFGCKYGGYCSDMTRTFCFGKPDAEFKQAYMAVLEAHMAAAEGIRAGQTGKQADALARDVLAGYGYDKFFTHSLGHGIGINIHEYPTLGPRSEQILEENMVFSIEPGVYFEGKFGIRIEDSACMAGGRAESFMRSAKELIVL